MRENKKSFRYNHKFFGKLSIPDLHFFDALLKVAIIHHILKANKNVESSVEETLMK